MFSCCFIGRFPDFLLGWMGVAEFMRLSVKKAAHVGIGECRVAGNPGAPSSRLAGESDSLVRVDTWQIDG
jgi:hypothetical protein